MKHLRSSLAIVALSTMLAGLGVNWTLQAQLVPNTPNIILTTEHGATIDIRAQWRPTLGATSYRFTSPQRSGTTPGTAISILRVPHGKPFTICLWARDASGESETPACRTLTIPLVVDTLNWRPMIRPKTVTVLTGGVVQFCSFIQFGDGKVARSTASYRYRPCDVEWSKTPPHLRTFSAVQQAIADRNP